MKKYNIIFLRDDKMLLSKKPCASWKEIQDEHEQYMTSLGFETLEAIRDYIIKEYKLERDDAVRMIHKFVESSLETMELKIDSLENGSDASSSDFNLSTDAEDTEYGDNMSAPPHANGLFAGDSDDVVHSVTTQEETMAKEKETTTTFAPVQIFPPVIIKQEQKGERDSAWHVPTHSHSSHSPDCMHKTLMKKTFVATSQNLIPECKQLIEELRNGVLDANQNGEFLQLGISPAVLTDDFVIRASTFMKIQRKEHCGKIVVGYWIKDAKRFPQVWLLAVLDSASSSRPGAIEKQPETLPLVTLSKKNWDPDNAFFDSVADNVMAILKDFFPDVRRRPTSATDNDSSDKQIPITKTGTELQAALLKYKAMREQGIHNQRDDKETDIETNALSAAPELFAAQAVVEEPEMNRTHQSLYENTSVNEERNDKLAEREKLVPATTEKKLTSLPVAEPVVASSRVPPVVVLTLKAFFISLLLFLILSWLVGEVSA